MCEVLGVSPSGYYAWRTRRVSAAHRGREDREPDREHSPLWRGTSGAPRVLAEVRLSYSLRCSGKRAGRWCGIWDRGPARASTKVGEI